MARRGENIYKRKDGRWEGRYIKKRALNNKAIYGYVYAKTYSDVKLKLLDRKLTSIDDFTEKKTYTISEISIIWLDNIKNQVKQSTYVKYRNTVYNHIITDIGDINITAFNTHIMREFIKSKLTHGALNGIGGLSPKTVKDIVSVIKLIFYQATEMEVEFNCNFNNLSVNLLNKVNRKNEKINEFSK